jgi:hypothetical protein
MKYFGLFASLGVGLALLYSLVLLPSLLILLRKKPSPNFKGADRPDPVARLMKALAVFVWRHTGLVVAVSALVVVFGLVGALRLKVNDERIDSFAPSEPLTRADKVINGTTDGSHYVDILVDTGSEEGLFQPAVLQQLEGLQQFGRGLPHVKGSVSIVDYVKQMNRVLNEDQPSEWRLPVNPDLVAQYFLLYSASGDPTDFDHLADGRYARGNVRLRLDTQNYAVINQTVQLLEQYIKDHFDPTQARATVSGAVKLHQHWLSILKNNHFLSVGFSLLAIFIVAALSFRSFGAGLYALLPVSVSLLFLYAVMGYTGMTLSVGTSMFAAISLGAGIDFAIHAIDRFQLLIKERGFTFQQAFAAFYAGTGRALFYSFACLLLGFGVLVTSSVVPLIRFGSLMGVSALASFIATMTLLPALFKLTQPAFLGLERKQPEPYLNLVGEPITQ